MQFTETEQELHEALKIQHNGTTMAYMGVYLELFFKSGSIEEKEKLILDVIEPRALAFYKMFPGAFNYCNSPMGPLPIGMSFEAYLEAIYDYFTDYGLIDVDNGETEENTFTYPLDFFSSKEKEDAPSIGFELKLETVETEKESGFYSYLKIHVPLAAAAAWPGGFSEYAQDWVQALQPDQGSFGFGFSHGMENTVARDSLEGTALIYRTCRQFPGLDFCIPSSIGHKIDFGLKPVNWGNVISNRWLEKIGGIEKIKEALKDEEDFSFVDYGGGYIIFAGETPQATGPEGEGHNPPHYEKLGKLLSRLRNRNTTTGFGQYAHNPVNELYGRCNFHDISLQKWWGRFDD